jgi:CheY-like chemotaxis protein
MKNNYVVRVLDLPEHEQVILKLIFSVSEKSNLRSNTYTLAGSIHEPADVVIRDARVAYVPSTDVRRELLVVDAPASTIDAPVILRPLIATRVLAVLDDVFAAATSPPVAVVDAHETNSEPVSAQDGTAALISSAAAQSDFLEPVIVQGQAHEQPANLEVPEIPASQGADVAAAVDAALLRIPDEEPRADIFDTAENTDELTPVAHSKPRVLVVDDSSSVCKQLAIEFLQFNVEVDYVPSARKAVEMLKKFSYRVAFLDVVLPDWDGFQICKHIKSKAPDTIVVMLTGKATASDKLRGALVGCDAYLVKPIARQAFQATLKSHLPLASNPQALGA